MANMVSSTKRVSRGLLMSMVRNSAAMVTSDDSVWGMLWLSIC